MSDQPDVSVQPVVPELLSVVIRFHSRERLGFLDEALFSLATQEWRPLEAVIAVQNGDEGLLADINALAQMQPWDEGCSWRIVPVSVPAGVDGRSLLLNRGIESATGQYLAFLDDDDVVYHHGYPTLIGALRDGTKALAIGGCRSANIRQERDHWFVTEKNKDYTWGSTRYDLFVNNFVPIHAYVIDRMRLGDFVLRFDESMTFLEDYDFLLRLVARFDPDMTNRTVAVCEYRIRDDGSNTIPHNDRAPAEAVAGIERARRIIDERRQGLVCEVSAVEMMQISHALRERDRYLRERNRLLMKAARRLAHVTERYPQLRTRLSEPFRTVTRFVGRIRQLF